MTANPFKLKILVRKKIVADGLNDSTFDVNSHPLSAKEMNELLEQSNTVVVDMRNHYERSRTLQNAILPDVTTFRESLPIISEMRLSTKDKNLVMYCTGGIRCEKASAYMKHKDIKCIPAMAVSLNIHDKSKTRDSKINHRNQFVLTRLGERISDHIIAHCHQCGAP